MKGKYKPYVEGSKIGWSTLASFGNNKVIRAFNLWVFLVPVLTKILSGISENINFMFFGEKITLVMGLPFSLFSLYVSALAFFIANILFMMFCPPIIKSYGSFNDYQLKDGSYEKIKQDFERYLSKIDDENINSCIELFLERVPHKKLVGGLLSRDKLIKSEVVEDGVGEAFAYLRGILEYEVQWAQKLCFAVYLIGMCFAGYVLFQNCIYVFNYTFA